MTLWHGRHPSGAYRPKYRGVHKIGASAVAAVHDPMANGVHHRQRTQQPRQDWLVDDLRLLVHHMVDEAGVWCENPLWSCRQTWEERR